ncbi:hypothetical protein, partial [Pseudoalteromonas aurantia]
VIALGNAIGNSIVSGIQRSEHRKYMDQVELESAMGQKLKANTATTIDKLHATTLNNQVDPTMLKIDQAENRMLWAIDRNNAIDADAQFAADEARRASRQQGVVDRANGLSASLSSQASALESRHLNQIAGIQASADAAFAKGVARGEAMYAAGVRNREKIGVDLLKGVDVEGNIAWGQQQRSKFNHFYNNLNLVQKTAFDTGVWVNEQVVDTGIAIGNTAKFGAEVVGLLIDGADIRIAASVSNKASYLQPEWKVYGGTDYAFGGSYKSGKLGVDANKLSEKGLYQGNVPALLDKRLKANVATHVRFESFSDMLKPESWTPVPILENDPLGDLNLYSGLKVKNIGVVDFKASPGTRTNLLTGDTRSSLNIKASTPEWIFGGWQLTLGIDIRK